MVGSIKAGKIKEPCQAKVLTGLLYASSLSGKSWGLIKTGA
jgi:hypothetical protein